MWGSSPCEATDSITHRQNAKKSNRLIEPISIRSLLDYRSPSTVHHSFEPQRRRENETNKDPITFTDHGSRQAPFAVHRSLFTWSRATSEACERRTLEPSSLQCATDDHRFHSFRDTRSSIQNAPTASIHVVRREWETRVP